MAYAPIAYTTNAKVQRLLRTSNNKIRVGTAPGCISSEDVDAYIIDASEFIDGFCRSVIGFDNLPIVSYAEKPEVIFAATRIAAYFIVQSMYFSYRSDDQGKGSKGWMDEAESMLVDFKKHINEGVYVDLSPATGGMQFVTSQRFFQTQIGIRQLETVRNDQTNSAPIKSTNIGPYQGTDAT